MDLKSYSNTGPWLAREILRAPEVEWCRKHGAQAVSGGTECLRKFLFPNGDPCVIRLMSLVDKRAIEAELDPKPVESVESDE